MVAALFSVHSHVFEYASYWIPIDYLIFDASKINEKEKKIPENKMKRDCNYMCGVQCTLYIELVDKSQNR